MLRTNENIWEFELNSKFRNKSGKYKIYRYFSDLDPFGFYAPGIIYRGKLTTQGRLLLAENDFYLEWSEKPRFVITADDSYIRRISQIPNRYLKILLNIHFNRFNF